MFFILITVVPKPADEDQESGRDDQDEESGGDDEDEEQDDSEQDDSVQESKGGDDDEEEIIIEEDDESKGEQDEVPPKTTPVLKRFTNLIKSFLSTNGKETATEPTTTESDDHRIEANNTLSILCAQVEKEVQAEVLKHSYKELRSKCSQLKLGGNGTAAVLRNRLLKFLIEERFRLQLMEFEKQIKTHKPDADPEEDDFDLNQTSADFKSTFVDI
jgi:cobalamin biosynthesis protein CobT